jgi:hypothetical protein
MAPSCDVLTYFSTNENRREYLAERLSRGLARSGTREQALCLGSGQPLRIHRADRRRAGANRLLAQ